MENKHPREQTCQPFERVQERIVGVGLGGVFDAVVERVTRGLGTGRLTLLQAQERMTEGRGGVIQKIGDVHHRN